MIPIANLYYVLLYAWDALEEKDLLDVHGEPQTSIFDLLAGVLHRGVDRLLRRGLDRGYLPRREDIPSVRGKVDLSATIKGGLLHRARTVCEFTELSHDVPHNKVLKATVRQLLRVKNLPQRLHQGLKATYQRLPGITDVPLTDRLFRSIQLHRNIQGYRFLLDVCRLIHECLIPDEAPGVLRFRDFLRDQERMHRLFERFIRNFYWHEQSTYRVRREHIRWQDITGDPEHLGLLPRMETDVSLTSLTRKIVIDAKFYQEPLQQRFGHDSLRSGHLYQMFAYLKNLAGRGDVNANVEGMLLYPAVSRHLALKFRLHGHTFHVCTINLNQHWSQIHKDLLALLAETGPAG
jgi:5-methylcytosine-specific restriction enzyme subunit McrC